MPIIMLRKRLLQSNCLLLFLLIAGRVKNNTRCWVSVFNRSHNAFDADNALF